MNRSLTHKEINHTRRLLVRSTNWIGDAVMTTPAIRAIRDGFPNARISLLVKPWVAPVFDACPHIDEVIHYDAKGRHKGVSGLLRLSRELRKKDFDTAILLQNAFEAALIAFLSGIKKRIGFNSDARTLLLSHPVLRTKAIRSIHQTGYYLEILNGIGLPGGSQDLELFIGADQKERADQILEAKNVMRSKPIVGINPSATFGPAKQWFPEKYAALADRIHDAFDAAILIFGGPDDKALGKAISGMMKCRPIDLSGRTTLGEAMALIETCSAFITNDSGLMHVGAALKTPLVAVFGSTNFTTTGPFSSNSRIVHVPIECSPCMKPVCPLGTMACMKKISVDRVFNAVKEML